MDNRGDKGEGKKRHEKINYRHITGCNDITGRCTELHEGRSVGSNSKLGNK